VEFVTKVQRRIIVDRLEQDFSVIGLNALKEVSDRHFTRLRIHVSAYRTHDLIDCSSFSALRIMHYDLLQFRINF
jgi:hypothetical protein